MSTTATDIMQRGGLFIKDVVCKGWSRIFLRDSITQQISYVGVNTFISLEILDSKF